MRLRSDTTPIPAIGHQTVRVVAALGIPALLAAQQPMAPAGWTAHLDASQQMINGQEVAPGEWRFEAMPPGWHMTTTEQGVTLTADRQVLHGRWGVEVELYLFPDPSAAPLGIALQGRDAELSPDSELRFLMRRDGSTGLLMHLNGADTMLVPWTRDTAIVPHAGGVEKHVLRLVHERDRVIFSIDGHEAFVAPAEGEGHRVAPGLRVGPGLNVHVSRFDVITPRAPARRRGP